MTPRIPATPAAAKPMAVGWGAALVPVELELELELVLEPVLELELEPETVSVEVVVAEPVVEIAEVMVVDRVVGWPFELVVVCAETQVDQ